MKINRPRELLRRFPYREIIKLYDSQLFLLNVTRIVNILAINNLQLLHSKINNVVVRLIYGINIFLSEYLTNKIVEQLTVATQLEYFPIFWR